MTRSSAQPSTKFTQYELNEETHLKSVRLWKDEFVDGTRMDSYQMTIDDEEVIEQMVANLSQLKLKKDFCHDGFDKIYWISFEIFEEIEEGIYNHREFSISLWGIVLLDIRL